MNGLHDILRTLHQLKPILRDRFYVSSIGIFGSVARNEQATGSDIDIIVDFTKPVGIEFVDLADYLESKLKAKIDLVSLKGIKQQYLNSIQPDIVYV